MVSAVFQLNKKAKRQLKIYLETTKLYPLGFAPSLSKYSTLE